MWQAAYNAAYKSIRAEQLAYLQAQYEELDRPYEPTQEDRDEYAKAMAETKKRQAKMKALLG